MTVSTAPSVTIAAPDTALVGVPVAHHDHAAWIGQYQPTPAADGRREFGDGNSQTLTNITGTVGLTHTYPQRGGFTISATATDVAGNTGITSKAIVVSSRRRRRRSPHLPNPADVNQVVGFSVSTTAAATDRRSSPFACSWRGTVIYVGNRQSGAFTRAFSATGTYVVVAEATDSAGGVGRTAVVVVP